jgi:tol-pal system-associated acyl-CoA thioesterase
MSAFALAARVYWEDTDAGGVVYYANYLKFLERARTEWLRTRGHVQTELAAEAGVLFAVAEVNIRYKRPARLDDLLLISCAPALDGAASVLFRQQVHRDGPARELLVDAEVRVVCVDTKDFRPRRVPAAIAAELR